MFFDGYIGAPPTLTVFSFIGSANSGAGATAANARTAALASKARRLDMMDSMLQNGVRRRTAAERSPASASSQRDTGRSIGRFHCRSHARVNGGGVTPMTASDGAFPRGPAAI